MLVHHAQNDHCGHHRKKACSLISRSGKLDQRLWGNTGNLFCHLNFYLKNTTKFVILFIQGTVNERLKPNLFLIQ